MRSLVFNFDGTNNGRTDLYPTNVQRFHNAANCPDQVSWYSPGPGDDDISGLIGHILGLAFGAGIRDIRDQALAAYTALYQPRDKVFITGFSRGASCARMFAKEVTDVGFEVEFLGVWDTVLAEFPIGPLQQDTLFGDLHVSPLVKNAFHAISLNEDRAAFAPNLMEARPGVEQVWFYGNHADVGGGYEEHGLANISLNWMQEKASGCGLSLDFKDFKPSPVVLHREDGSWRRKKRAVPSDALIHGSVNSFAKAG